MRQQINIHIAKMKNEDVPTIVKLEELSYGEHHWSAESFYNEIKNELAHYYIAKNEEGKIIGYIGFWIIFEEAHITTLSVHPEFRKMNVASILLNETIKCCYKNMVKFLTLEVRVSNIPAISLYEKFGFYSIGIRKAYYQNNNEDAMIMFTNNIFYSQFKNVYDKTREKIENIEITYDEAFEE